MTDKTLKDKKHALIGLLNRGKWDNCQILFWIDEIIDTALTAERERLVSEIKELQTYKMSDSSEPLIERRQVIYLINPPSNLIQ